MNSYSCFGLISNFLNYLQVETRNRFRCLRSKPVDIEERKNNILSEVSTSTSSSKQQGLSECTSPKSKTLREREIFHDTFAFLIRLVR